MCTGCAASHPPGTATRPPPSATTLTTLASTTTTSALLPPSTTTTTAPAPPTTAAAAPPAPIAQPGWTPGPGYGLWTPVGRTVGSTAAVYTTVLDHDRLPLGVAWMDTSRLRFVLYAGTSEPHGVWPDQGAVPPSLWNGLVAAFNSGFQLRQSAGGWYDDGRAAVPLRAGGASLVIYADGSATVADWGRDASLTAQVRAVRQNLTLLVDGGKPTPAVYSSNPIATWGDPLHENVYTWRSALGIDATGHLLYIAGPGLDPETLAAAMVAVGALRAMELDINPEWLSYVSFTGVGSAITGVKLLDTMYFPTDHFLQPFWRDFVAVFARAD